MQSQRVVSIDIVRGLVMVLMAIDHTRVYAGMPGGPDTLLFLSRWITHFCVSGFVFFAGTGIFFHAKKIQDTAALSRYLLIRGLLLVFLELTLIRFCWSFNIDPSTFILAGVIWMLGWCMVLMALLTRLSTATLVVTGTIIVFGQQMFHYLPRLFPENLRQPVAYVWNFFYPTGLAGFEPVSILYTIIPWIGVMMLGYTFGNLLLRSAPERKKICLWIGGSATVLYLLTGGILILSGENDNELPFILRLLNQSKYPASQLFLMMTLGPLIMLLPFVEEAKNRFSKMLLTFGRVPLFFYVLHILFIHLSALLVNTILHGNAHQDWYRIAPFYTQQPEPDQWGLPILYLVFAVNIGLLYIVCSWYAAYKQRHPGKAWLKYF